MEEGVGDSTSILTTSGVEPALDALLSIVRVTENEGTAEESKREKEGNTEASD